IFENLIKSSRTFENYLCCRGSMENHDCFEALFEGLARTGKRRPAPGEANVSVSRSSPKSNVSTRDRLDNLPPPTCGAMREFHTSISECCSLRRASDTVCRCDSFSIKFSKRFQIRSTDRRRLTSSPRN